MRIYCISYIWQIPKSRFNNQCLKKKKIEKEERDLNGMDNLKIKSRYLQLCYEFRDFIKCIKAAFYRPDYQKFLLCPLIKTLGREFVSKNATEPLKREAKLLRV